MKILYAIQGTGNGHLARATEIVPLLKSKAETDVLVSGIQSDIQLPFNIDYQLYGASFIFGIKGGVDIPKTLSCQRMLRFWSDVFQLPVNKYDIIMCDYEPVTAWACFLKGIPCIGISHQNAVLHPKAPKPAKTDPIGKFILKHYAPVSSSFGFHFEKLGHNFFNPVIRKEIRNATPTNNGHYTVYLPAYNNNEIETILSNFVNIRWEVFSKHCDKTYKKNNIIFRPVSNKKFIQSFVSCSGILCTAGFETPSEAIHMGKKLCVIPMKRQYEQACNAAFLKHMGITVLQKLEKQGIKQWLKSKTVLKNNYPNETDKLLSSILTLPNNFKRHTPGKLLLETLRFSKL